MCWFVYGGGHQCVYDDLANLIQPLRLINFHTFRNQLRSRCDVNASVKSYRRFERGQGWVELLNFESEGRKFETLRARH
jgi:hypothetical protein